jgi:hypothetical protein
MVNFPARSLNDRFARRAAVQSRMPLQQNLRCERAQQENQIHMLGSAQPFATL